MKQKPLSPAPFFSRLHILAQNRVDHSLITPPVLAEKSENIGIDAQSNLFLRPQPEDRICEKIRPKLGRVGEVNILVTCRDSFIRRVEIPFDERTTSTAAHCDRSLIQDQSICP
jgi:hypothetical protein